MIKLKEIVYSLTIVITLLLNNASVHATEIPYISVSESNEHLISDAHTYNASIGMSNDEVLELYNEYISQLSSTISENNEFSPEHK